MQLQRLSDWMHCFRTGETDSEIYKLNQNGGGSISEDTSYLLERALEIWKSTDGCFEIGIYPLMQEWGFTDGNYKSSG